MRRRVRGNAFTGHALADTSCEESARGDREVSGY